MDGEVFCLDGLVATGSSHKLAGTLRLDINSQRCNCFGIVKTLYSIAISIANSETCTIAQNQVDAAIVAKLAVHHDIAALHDIPIGKARCADGCTVGVDTCNLIKRDSVDGLRFSVCIDVADAYDVLRPHPGDAEEEGYD